MNRHTHADLGLIASTVLLIGGLAWVNNPATRIFAPDITAASSYVPVATVGVLLAGVALARIVANRNVRLISLDRPILALAAMLVLGLGVGAIRHNHNVLLFGDAAQIAEFIVYYFVGTRSVHTRAQLQWIVAAIAACTLTSTLVSVAAFASGSGNSVVSIDGQDLPRYIDNFPAMILPLFVAAVWLGPAWVRMLSVASLAPLAAGVFLSFTRSLWLGGVVAVVSAALLYGPSELRRAIGARLIAPLVVAVVLSSMLVVLALRGSTNTSPFDLALARVTYTAQQFLHPASELQSRRQDEAAAILDQVAQTPLVGIGLGGEYLGPNGVRSDQLSTGNRHFVHDTFLAVLLRTGIVGLALFAVFLFGLLREGVRRNRRSADAWERLLAITATASFIGGVVISLTADALVRHPFAAYYGVLIGLMANPWIFQKDGLASAPI